MQPHVKIALKARGIHPEDNWVCEACATPYKLKDLQVHHIEPKGMGGNPNADREDNLIIVCRGCHSLAHANNTPEAREQLAVRVEEILRRMG